MHAHPDTLDMVATLKSRGEPFALATVVRTVSVTAAKAGAKAVIRPDGTITEGWIGGGCARAAVLKAARESIADGRPRLVSIQPKDLLEEHGVVAGQEKDGVKFANNMCPSQGSMDVFVEPVLPKPSLVIFGASPVAVALADIAPRFGYRVVVCAPSDDQKLFAAADQRIEGFALPVAGEGQRYVVVSTQGRGDEAALRSALSIDAEHIGFVGSSRKMAALRESLLESGTPPERFNRLKGPAGLDLGAVTPEEIALSILAEILMIRRNNQRAATITTA
ncbi:MAG: XdhC /CoxI family-like protein [Bradyrhizobiaceae bacterium]|nr:MAG: XdhC /CoxI family-like protein [Bradyrhizobiaceae bacterium]